MKIVGFAQLHEELRKGNLLHWLASMEAACDFIYVWDQGSRDGSLEVYRQHPKLVVVEHPRNDFNREMVCKAQLLEKLQAEHSDADWIFWMDGDTVLERGGPARLRNAALTFSADIGILGHYNLWRGHTHYRVDSLFHELHTIGVYALWRNRPGLHFPRRDGLHHFQYPLPPGIDEYRFPLPITTERVGVDLVHLGFTTDAQIHARNPPARFFAPPVLMPFDLDRLPEGITPRASEGRLP